MQTPYQRAAEHLLERLLVWHKLAQQCRDKGEEGEWIDIRDMWASGDQAAIDEFATAKATALGAQPLFHEEAS